MLLSQNIGNNNEIDNNYCWYFPRVEHEVFLLLQLPQNIWNPRVNINITSFCYLFASSYRWRDFITAVMIGMQICHNLAVTFDLHLKSQISHCCLYMYKCIWSRDSSSDPQHQTSWTIYALLKYSYSNITKYYFEGGCHIKSLGDPCFAEIKTIHFIRILANCITYFCLIWT